MADQDEGARTREGHAIRCARHDRILRITLDRPAVLNAIDGTMLREIREAVAQAEAAAGVRAILVDSACARAFSAGIDVAWVKGLSGFDVRAVGRDLHRTFLALRRCDKPALAAVDGLCLGAGLELALSCDLMIATDRSTFGLPNIHRGIPAIVEAALLPLAVGIQGARELALTGESWDAAKAERRGLLAAVATPTAFPAAVERWCGLLADKSPGALSTQKEILFKWMTTDLESAIDFSINTVPLNFATPDQQEGMGAFLDKRPAVL